MCRSDSTDAWFWSDIVCLQVSIVARLLSIEFAESNIRATIHDGTAALGVVCHATEDAVQVRVCVVMSVHVGTAYCGVLEHAGHAEHILATEGVL